MTAPIAIWFSIIIQRVPVVDQHPASDDPAKTLSELQCTIATSSVSRMVAMSNVGLVGDTGEPPVHVAGYAGNQIRGHGARLEDATSQNHGPSRAVERDRISDHTHPGRPAGNGCAAALDARRMVDDGQRQHGRAAPRENIITWQSEANGMIFDHFFGGVFTERFKEDLAQANRSAIGGTVKGIEKREKSRA
jgi:hypothetical protein